MFQLSKQSIIHFVVLLAVAIATGWFLVHEAKKTGDSLQKIGFVSIQTRQTQTSASGETNLSALGQRGMLNAFKLSINRFKEEKSGIEKDLQKVLDETMLYDSKKGNTEMFSKGYTLSTDPYAMIEVSAFHYEKGSRFVELYEATKFETNLDDVVDAFRALKEGKQKSIVVGHLGNELANVECRQIGVRKFAVYDTVFKPGGVYSRSYATFDESAKRYIIVSFSYAFYGDEDFSPRYSSNGELEYPTEITYFIKSLEEMIGQIK